jgi:ubiquinone/menaquinone biosynthesis C-methylase UbiE
MLKRIVFIILAPFLLAISWLLLARIVRHFYKFPMPEFMADFITNPGRRKVQPPDETAVRHGIQPGMTVLDIGPGNGTYTIAAAQRAGPDGKLFAIDIEPRMIERVVQNAAAAGVENIEARVADVYDMPFSDEFFDVITMIAVIGEIPEPDRALMECYRVLKLSGILAISEIMVDPDSKRPSTLRREVEAGGFHFKEKLGNWFVYSMLFGKNGEE